MRSVLLCPAQPIAFGVEPYLGPVGRFDDASRMNGAEMLPGWRLETGSHKDIGAVARIHRPARVPTEQISRNAPITTPHQLTFPGFSQHYCFHIRLVLEPSFKQGFEQTGLHFLFSRIHEHVPSFHAHLCSPHQSIEVGVQLRPHVPGVHRCDSFVFIPRCPGNNLLHRMTLQDGKGG